jgi:PAS domain S-box-containing protein
MGPRRRLPSRRPASAPAEPAGGRSRPQKTRAELIVEIENLRRRMRAPKRQPVAPGEREGSYRMLVEHAVDVVLICALDGTILDVNRAAEAISGWSRQELVGQSVAKMLTPASFALGQERVRRSLAGERLPKLFGLEALRKDHTVVPLEGWARFILDRRNRPIAHLGVYRDVSERRRTGAALGESEERYRSLLENANDPIATMSLDGIILSVNRALERTFGYAREELIGQHYAKFVTPATHAEWLERTRRVVAGEKLPDIAEIEVVRRDGVTIPVEVRGSIIRDKEGRPALFQAIFREIAERKRDEQALRTSEERYRAMFGEAEEQRQVLDRLYRVTASMQVSWEPKDRLHAFVQGVHEVLGFDRFYVALASPDRSTFDVAAAVGLEMFERLPLSPAAGPLYHAFKTQRPLAVLTDEDLGRVPPFGFEYRDRSYFRSRRFIVAPLVTGDRVIGVASADNKTTRRPITSANVELFALLCQQLATALEEARLYAEARAHEEEVAARNRDLTEALEQQTATATILRTMSRSPSDLQPVLDAVAENAARLLEADNAQILRVEDEKYLRPVASFGEMKAFTEGERRPISRGFVTGRAVADRQTIHLHDLLALVDSEFPEAKDLQRHGGHRTTLVTPLLREGAAIGAIVILRGEVRPFTDKQISLMETFADQAVIAIENVRLFQELQARTRELARSVEELRALSEVGQAVSSTLVLDTVLDTIAARAAQLSAAQWGLIYEYDETKLEFHLRASHRLDEEFVRVVRAAPIRLGEGVAGKAAAIRAAVQVADIRDERTYEVVRIRTVMERRGLRSLLAVPLLLEQRIIGALVVSRQEPGSFAPEVVNLLQTFASQSVLAIENARLFRELEHKSRELEAASRHKSEFLANMSHELRTPLNAVIGFSEALLERMFGEVNEKQTEYLQDILSSGQHLLSLINDILDLSKIEAGRMELAVAPFHLPQALDNALILVKERAARHGIGLALEIDPRLGELVGDERKVKQALLNLLSNAVKFTPEGGRISLRAVQADGAVEIAVSDTGIGIAPEDQEAIFEEFRQVGSDEARKQEGTGLGLALTKKIVEMHGGRIWVKSQVGKGSTFTFTLPVRA